MGLRFGMAGGLAGHTAQRTSKSIRCILCRLFLPILSYLRATFDDDDTSQVQLACDQQKKLEEKERMREAERDRAVRSKARY